jgi:ligand-binding sensor domain-containing protein
MNKLPLFIILITMTFANAQSKFTIITKENSNLPDNDLWSICKNDNTNIWIGSANSGVIEYDNTNYSRLNKNEIFGRSIITFIFKDNKSNTWFSLWKPDKLVKFDGSKFEIVENKFISNKSIIEICEDKNGNVYFGGDNILAKFDGDKWSEIKLPSSDIVIRSIDINKDNEIAIGHNNGLLIFKNDKWSKYTTENSELQLSVVRAVKFTNDNKLLIGYGGGLGKGGLSLLENKNWKHYNKSNSKILDHTVSDIEVDKDGLYWLATNNGLTKFKNDEVVETLIFREGNYHNTIMDITIQGNNIWLATTQGIIKIEN